MRSVGRIGGVARRGGADLRALPALRDARSYSTRARWNAANLSIFLNSDVWRSVRALLERGREERSSRPRKTGFQLRPRRKPPPRSVLHTGRVLGEPCPRPILVGTCFGSLVLL